MVQDVAQRHNRLFDALLVAAECGSVEFVRSKLQSCTVAELVEVAGAACRGGHLPAMQLLLVQGVGVDSVLRIGATLLIRAASWGYVPLVKELLARGADVNLPMTSDNRTALMVASKNGHVDVVKLLISGGSNVNATQTDGMSSLMWASQNGSNTPHQHALSTYIDADTHTHMHTHTTDTTQHTHMHTHTRTHTITRPRATQTPTCTHTLT